MKFLEKILGDKTQEKIKPYEGETYSSTDEEYAEFLENLNIINDGKETSGDTMKFRISRKEPSVEVVQTEEPEPEEKVAEESESHDFMPKMYMSATDDKLLSISSSVERLTNIVENNDIRKEHILDKVLDELSSISSQLAEIKSAQDRLRNNISEMSKVGDSVFDLKNTLQSTKNSMINLETAFSRLKKKFISCITLLSVLSFLIIILQILNLFS